MTKRLTKKEMSKRLADVESRLDRGELVDTTQKVGAFVEGIEFDMGLLEYATFVSAFVFVASEGKIPQKKMVDTMMQFGEVFRKRLFGEVVVEK